MYRCLLVLFIFLSCQDFSPSGQTSESRALAAGYNAAYAKYAGLKHKNTQSAELDKASKALLEVAAKMATFGKYDPPITVMASGFDYN